MWFLVLSITWSMINTVLISHAYCLPLQLKVKEAFKLCRYEWMRRALEEFLKLIAENGRLQMTDSQIESVVVEPPSTTVSDVVADSQIVSSNCYVKPSSGQHHAMSAITPLSLRKCLSRGCHALTWGLKSCWDRSLNCRSHSICRLQLVDVMDQFPPVPPSNWR